MRDLKRVALILAGLLLLASCRTAPLYNVEHSSFNTTAQPSLSEVTQAIQRAGTSLGWQMNVERPGLIIGTLNLRSHQAVVEIPYDTNSFSIHYQDSTNLKYDGSNIHKNYNSWIQNLEREIRLQAGLV